MTKNISKLFYKKIVLIREKKNKNLDADEHRFIMINYGKYIFVKKYRLKLSDNNHIKS